MAKIASLLVDITGDSTGLSNSLKSASKQMQAFGDRMTSIGTMMSATLTAPIVAFGGLAVKAFTVQEDAVAKLTGALRANGGQAGVTAEEIKQLASELQKVTKYGDEVTISASALLLTFHQIRNVAGEGNDVFNRTVKASQDLASALGTDLQSSVIQLAKALENPKIGLTALARSGTTFTEQQKAMIGALVDSGQQLKAQTMILDVVESQYKGIAEELRKTTGGTITGALNELGDEMETFGRIISESLIPFVNRLTDIVRAVASVDDQTKRFIVIMGGLVAIVGPAVLALGLITKGVVALGIAFTTSTGPIGMLITAIGLLTGAYVLHKMTVDDVVSTANAFIKNNTDFAKALHANAEEMKAFADASGRTADEIERVNDAFRVMVNQATSRANALSDQLIALRSELYELERSGRGNIFTGYGADSDRAKELREQIRALEASLQPLYGFLLKAKDGLDAFNKSAGDKPKVDVDTDALKFAEGSIGAVREELAKLEESFIKATTASERADLGKSIADLRNQIKAMEDQGAVETLEDIADRIAMIDQMLAETPPIGRLVGPTGDLMMMPTTLAQINQALSEYNAMLDNMPTQQTRDQVLAMINTLEGMRTQFMTISTTAPEAIQKISVEMQIARQFADQFTSSFGAGMSNIVIEGNKLIDVLENIGKLLLSSAIQTGIKLLLQGTSAFGGTGTGLFGFLGGIFGGGGEGPVTAITGSQNLTNLAGAGLKLDGAFKLSGNDLVLAINRSERNFR